MERDVGKFSLQKSGSVSWHGGGCDGGDAGGTGGDGGGAGQYPQVAEHFS